METKTKDELDESLKKLLGELGEETEENSGHVMLRRDRVGEMPVQAQERLNMIFDTEIASPVVRDGNDGNGLGMFYRDDEELGILALTSSFGVENGEFLIQQLNGLLQASGTGNDSRDELGKKATADIGIVAALEPRDAIESMLAAQMVATHRAIMKAAQQLNHAESIEPSNSAGNRMTKLMNMYTRQIETLNKHRGKGQQKMTVEHVHVNEGGQAIIGNVERGGNAKK